MPDGAATRLEHMTDTARTMPMLNYTEPTDGQNEKRIVTVAFDAADLIAMAKVVDDLKRQLNADFDAGLAANGMTRQDLDKTFAMIKDMARQGRRQMRQRRRTAVRVQPPRCRAPQRARSSRRARVQARRAAAKCTGDPADGEGPDRRRRPSSGVASC